LPEITEEANNTTCKKEASDFTYCQRKKYSLTVSQQVLLPTLNKLLNFD
jgi:hypothetical protein